MAGAEVRAAAEGDRAAVATIVCAIAAAGETYALPRDLTAAAAEALWFEPEPVRVLVADLEGGVAGSARYGPVRPAGGDHVATASFVVDPALAGRGVGRALGEAVLQRAAADGYRALQFNAVVETNRAAVRLWESLGFDVLATVPEAFRLPDGRHVGLHVMHRSLS